MKEKMRKWSKGFITVMLTAVVMLCVSISAKAEDITTIQTNTTIESCLESKDDVFYYGFEMDKTGYMNISFEPQIGFDETSQVGNGWRITLLGSDGNTTIFTNDVTSATEFPVYDFKEGTKFYLKVEAKSKFGSYAPVDVKYNITVNTTQADDWEQEENDTWETANTITPNKKYFGNLYTVTDVDYYCYTIDKAGYMNISFDPAIEFDGKGDIGSGWTVTLLGDDGNTIYTTNVTEAVELPIFDFKKGTKLYLKVEARGKTTSYAPLYVQYGMTVNTTASSKWEQESNDTIKTANTIAFGKTYSGNLYNKTDVDYYSITTTSKGFVNIAFNPVNSNSPDDSLGSGYNVSVYKSGKLLYTITDITAAKSAKIYLNKGTYYIKVEAKYKTTTYAPTFKTYSLKTSFTAFAKPAKAAIKSAKADTKYYGYINLKLKKVKNATGYQLQYSTKKTLKGKKSALLTTNIGTISGLTSKTTYYIRVRAYTETADGKKVYGAWSSTKSVKTK